MNDKRLGGKKTATAFKSLCRFSLFLAVDVFVYLFLKNDTTAQCSAKMCQTWLVPFNAVSWKCKRKPANLSVLTV